MEWLKVLAADCAMHEMEASSKTPHFQKLLNYAADPNTPSYQPLRTQQTRSDAKFTRHLHP